MTREEALAVAQTRKAERRRRTGRIRRGVAIAAVAAFLGPFGFIVSHSGSTKSGTTVVASTKAATTATTTTTTTPSAVTTQQS